MSLSETATHEEPARRSARSTMLRRRSRPPGARADRSRLAEVGDDGASGSAGANRPRHMTARSGRRWLFPDGSRSAGDYAERRKSAKRGIEVRAQRSRPGNASYRRYRIGRKLLRIARRPDDVGLVSPSACAHRPFANQHMRPSASGGCVASSGAICAGLIGAGPALGGAP